MPTAETDRAGKPGAISRRPGGLPRPSVALSHWVYPGLVILATLLAILPGILDSERACEPDSARYLGLGRRLFADGCYCNGDGSPHATTPPAYPVVAALVTIGGRQSAAIHRPAGAISAVRDEPDGREESECSATRPASRAALLLFQAFAFLVSVSLLQRLGRRCGLAESASQRVALLYGLSPLALVYVGRALSETLFVVLLLAGLCLLIGPRDARASARGDGWRPTLAGCLLGLAALTRILLVPWILLWPLFAALLPAWRRRLLWACLGAGLVLAPWVVRNWTAFGCPGLSAAGGTNALEYAAALIAPLEERETELRAVRGPAALQNPYAESNAQIRAAWRIVAKAPGAFLIRAARSFPAVLAPPVTELLQAAGSSADREAAAPAHREGAIRALHERGPGAALGEVLARVRSAPLEVRVLAVGLALWDLVILVAALVGLALTIIRRRPPDICCNSKALWLLLGSLVLLLLLSPVGAWHPRFRVPLAPAIALFAYLFIASILRLHWAVPRTEDVPCD